MSIGGRNAPLSPVSIGGSEWSFPPKLRHTEEGGLYRNNRGNLASPPYSGGSNGAMSMNGFPSGARSNGGPSPPPSVGRSSNGTNTYSARSEGNRNSNRTDIDDSVLGDHYLALRAFLNARDGNNRQQPNKARDKLLRLSSVQFYELSTDVYDELMRRQAAARAPTNVPGAPPSFLLPEKAFHPKRNQARQRLSSLGPARFRDLAADVFHELERRFPRFVGGDIPRVGSAMSVRGGRVGAPGNGNMFPPRGQSRMGTSDAGSARSATPGDAYGMAPSPGIDYGRPMPKQLNQNNTIVPNKSTMLEEDDGNGADEDGAGVFGLERVTNKRASKRSGESGLTSETDKKLIEDYQAQARELREKLDIMEDAMKKKDDEMNSVLDSERSRTAAADMEKKEWTRLRLNLENRLAEAQNLNKSMKQELQRVREDGAQENRKLLDELSALQSSSRSERPGIADPKLQKENEELRQSLRQQRQVIEDVRREGQECLREMRVLSQQSGSAYEKQAEMEETIERLEREARDWRNRYTRTRTQLRNMRASSLGLALEQDAAKYVRDKGFLADGGAVKDLHVTKFQTAIDELLHTARKGTPDRVMDAMKLVVVSVRRIARDVDESTPCDDEAVQQQAKLKARVSSRANGLITTSKDFAAGAGISPISLVDAAASHLVAAIVDLVGAVKIRATPASELEDDDDGSVTPVDSIGFFSPRSTAPASGQDKVPPRQGTGDGRVRAESSAYSPVSSARVSEELYPGGGTKGTTNGLGYTGLNKMLPTRPNG